MSATRRPLGPGPIPAPGQEAPDVSLPKFEPGFVVVVGTGPKNMMLSFWDLILTCTNITRPALGK